MKIKLFFIGVLGILYSCQQQNEVDTRNEVNTKVKLTPEEYLSILPHKNNNLSEIEAVNIVEEFVKDKPHSRVGFRNKIYIKDEAFLNKAQSRSTSRIPIYNVVVENEESRNIAIVSGDKRFPSVIAYFSEPDEKHSLVDANDLLIEMAKSVFLDNIAIVENLQDSLGESTLQKLSSELNIEIDQTDYENLKSHITVVNPQTKSTIIKDPDASLSRFGPFINVSWDIGMPYNRLMAQSCPDNWLWDNRYPISSAVVAVAQVMSMFQPAMIANGTSINWPYLKEKPEIHEETDYFGQYVQDPLDKRNMVSNLMLYIGSQCGVIYSCSSSSANMGKIIDFLKRYNILVNNVESFNASILKRTLDDIYPVIMTGLTNENANHIWIVDGYCSRVSTRGDTFFPGFDIYMHANMGMGNNYNGYYLVGSDGTLTFDTTFAHFTKNLRMYSVRI